MAEKTKKIFVRLTSDFPQGQEHRRAGLVIGAGAIPQAVEVTKKQLEAIEEDRYIQVMSKKEADEFMTHLPQSQHPATDGEATDVEEPQEDSTDEDDSTPDADESDEDTSSDEDESGNDPEEDETPADPNAYTAETKLTELQAIAANLGVENVDKLRSKQAAIDAIEDAKSKV